MFSAVMEIRLHEMLTDTQSTHERLTAMAELMRCYSQVWERFVEELYGKDSAHYIDSFGRYLILRSQRLRRAYLKIDAGGNQIYNSRNRRLY